MLMFFSGLMFTVDSFFYRKSIGQCFKMLFYCTNIFTYDMCGVFKQVDKCSKIVPTHKHDKCFDINYEPIAREVLVTVNWHHHIITHGK